MGGSPTASGHALPWLAAGLVAALALAATGCRGDAPSKASAVDAPAAPVAPATAPPPPAAFPDEVPGDPKSFDQPRLQFRWTAPGETKQSIWSIKIDGSDLRRAAGPDLLFSGEARSLYSTPVRSPDGRYIAVAGEDADDDLVRVLVDLRTRRVRTMAHGIGVPYFNWTPDSRHVLFYADVRLWDYDVEKGTLTKLPMIYSSGLRLVDGGRRFLAIHEDALEYYDRAGRKLERIPLPFRIQPDTWSISPDGSHIATFVDGKLVIFPIRDPRNVFRPAERPWGQIALGPAGRTVYFGGNVLTAVDTTTDRETEMRLPGDATAWEVTLMNAGAQR